MSAPATKAWSPAPRRTTTRMVSWGASPCTYAGIICHISRLTAFRFSGWLKMTQPIGPSLCSTSFGVSLIGALLGGMTLELCIALLPLDASSPGWRVGPSGGGGGAAGGGTRRGVARCSRGRGGPGRPGRPFVSPAGEVRGALEAARVDGGDGDGLPPHPSREPAIAAG